MAIPYKDSIQDVAQLEDILSEPTQETIDTMGSLDGDIVILGVGGKMGPTLARMAKRASDLAGVSRRVIGVSRFSTPGLPEKLHSWGNSFVRPAGFEIVCSTTRCRQRRLHGWNEIWLHWPAVLYLGHEHLLARTSEREISR